MDTFEKELSNAVNKHIRKSKIDESGFGALIEAAVVISLNEVLKAYQKYKKDEGL